MTIPVQSLGRKDRSTILSPSSYWSLKILQVF
nr:MAG TPA: hypothetical protein [Caudoviricetes sp.]